jgi:hypothetical protein
MIVIARTDTYTIFKKRNQRYAVKRNATRQWLHGDEKVAVLLAHNLAPTTTVRAPEHPERPDGSAPDVGAPGEGGPIPEEGTGADGLPE